MKELEEAKQIFLTDVDEETYLENQQKIAEWEESLALNQAYLHWRNHDITKEVNKLIKDAYKEHAIVLATNRSLTEEQRVMLWAKQDACLFLLQHTDKNAKSALEGVLREIKHALNATS